MVPPPSAGGHPLQADCVLLAHQEEVPHSTIQGFPFRKESIIRSYYLHPGSFGLSLFWAKLFWGVVAC